MSKTSYTILTNQTELSFTGDATRTDIFSGMTQNLHTVSISVNNFVGRFYVEGTIALNPTEDDWFPIYLTSGTPYREYPINSVSPTGTNDGDTVTEGFTFRANLLYIRARIDRSYLPETAYDSAVHGTIDKVILNI